jgi:ABC-type polysaccharide/polyol phosphate export permease
MRNPIDSQFAGYNYPIFILCGLLPWLFFSETVTRNCSSITENSVLVTKTVIPAEILPLSITLSSLIHHAIGLVILLVILVTFFQVHLSILFILLYLPIMVCLAQGLGWILAGLQVFVRDTIQVLQILIWLWFWFTPIVYTLDGVPTLKAIGRFNPLAVIITGYRNALLNQANPNLNEVAAVFALSLAIFVIGALLFRHAKPGFADVL